MKQCNSCKILKPLDDFHRDKRQKDGRVLGCKECRSKYKKEHYLRNKEKIDAQNRLWAEKNRSAKKESSKKYRLENKEKIALSSREYREKNRDKIFMQRKKNRHKAKEYQKQNSAKFAAIAAKRRAAQKQATPSWFYLEKEKIENLYILASDLRKSGKNVHVDHIVPLINKKVCGLHTLANLQILEATKNLRKNNRFEV